MAIKKAKKIEPFHAVVEHLDQKLLAHNKETTEREALSAALLEIAERIHYTLRSTLGLPMGDSGTYHSSSGPRDYTNYYTNYYIGEYLQIQVTNILAPAGLVDGIKVTLEDRDDQNLVNLSIENLEYDVELGMQELFTKMVETDPKFMTEARMKVLAKTKKPAKRKPRKKKVTK